MNEEVGCRGSSELNAVDFVCFVVSVPGNNHCPFEFHCSLFAHVLNNFEQVSALQDSGARIDLQAQSVVGERNEREPESPQDLEADVLNVVLLEFGLFVELAFAQLQVPQRLQLVLYFYVNYLNYLSSLLLVRQQSLQVQLVRQLYAHSIFGLHLFVFTIPLLRLRYFFAFTL